MRELIVDAPFPKGAIVTLVEMVGEYLCLEKEEMFHAQVGVPVASYPDDTSASEIFDSIGDYTYENHVILVPSLIRDKDGKRSPLSGRCNQYAFDLMVSLWGLDYMINKPTEMFLERIAKVMSRGIGRALEMGECEASACVMRPALPNYGETAVIADFANDIEKRRGICGNHRYGSPVS